MTEKIILETVRSEHSPILHTFFALCALTLIEKLHFHNQFLFPFSLFQQLLHDPTLPCASLIKHLLYLRISNHQVPTTVV